MRRFIKAFIFLPVIALFSVIVFATKVLASPISVSLNTNYSVYLGQNGMQEFTFSTVNGYYYVVDTSGTGVTTLMLTMGNLTITDNYDGSHNKAKIKFEGTGSTAHIYLSYYIHYQQGTVNLQIRRMQAVLCGFNYGSGDINTEADLTVPNNLFSSNYDTYLLTDETNHTPSYVLQDDNRGYPRIDSEIFFFSGHGGPWWASFPSDDLDREELPLFHNCSIAVISACQCALHYPSTDEDSFIETIAGNYAETALGWEETISASDAKAYTDYFFTHLAAGYTVYASCCYAISWFNDYTNPIYSYVVKGNKYNTLFTGNSQYRSNDDSQLEEIYQFNQNRSSYDLCITFDNDPSHYRYYKTINGCITNDYYDVWYNNDDIELIIKSEYNLTNQYVYSINYSGYECDPLDTSIVDTSNTIMYYLTNNSAIPVEITYITRQVGEFKTLDVKCINLYNGESFDYSKLSK